MNGVQSAIASLRSTRVYDGRIVVTEEQVESWLNVARWCGSSKNSQPWRFAVVRDGYIRQVLAECGDHAKHLADAPVVIVIAALAYPHEFSSILDLGRVAQSLMVSAHSEGVGSCIAVFEPEHDKVVRSVLHFPRHRGRCKHQTKAQRR